MNEIVQAMEESSFGVAIKEKGRIEGRVQGLILATQIMWVSRFGAMPVDFVAAVEKSSERQLHGILALFSKGPTEAEMRTKLGI